MPSTGVCKQSSLASCENQSKWDRKAGGWRGDGWVRQTDRNEPLHGVLTTNSSFLPMFLHSWHHMKTCYRANERRILDINVMSTVQSSLPVSQSSPFDGSDQRSMLTSHEWKHYTHYGKHQASFEWKHYTDYRKHQASFDTWSCFVRVIPLIIKQAFKKNQNISVNFDLFHILANTHLENSSTKIYTKVKWSILRMIICLCM